MPHLAGISSWTIALVASYVLVQQLQVLDSVAALVFFASAVMLISYALCASRWLAEQIPPRRTRVPAS